MPKRTFEIEWPDDLGPMWMNADNLMICLTETCRNTQFTITDVTGDMPPRSVTDGPLGTPNLRSRFEQLARTYEKSVPYCGVQIRDVIEDAGKRIRWVLDGNADFHEFLDLNAPPEPPANSVSTNPSKQN